MPFIPGGEASWLVTRHVFQSRYERLYSFSMDWRPSAAPSQEELQSFVDTLHAELGNEVNDVMDHEDKFVQTTADFRNLENVQREAFRIEDFPGTMGDVLEDGGEEIDAMPAYVAVCFQKRTDKPGRSKRGRFFLPCISEQVQHDGIVDILNRGALRQIADIFQTERPLGGGTCAPRLYDRKNNVGVPIAACYPMDVLVTRRDRKLGRPGIRITV